MKLLMFFFLVAFSLSTFQACVKSSKEQTIQEKKVPEKKKTEDDKAKKVQDKEKKETTKEVETQSAFSRFVEGKLKAKKVQGLFPGEDVFSNLALGPKKRNRLKEVVFTKKDKLRFLEIKMTEIKNEWFESQEELRALKSKNRGSIFVSLYPKSGEKGTDLKSLAKNSQRSARDAFEDYFKKYGKKTVKSPRVYRFPKVRRIFYVNEKGNLVFLTGESLKKFRSE